MNLGKTPTTSRQMAKGSPRSVQEASVRRRDQAKAQQTKNQRKKLKRILTPFSSQDD